MSQRWQNILAPVGVWIHQRLTTSSEKIIEQYYENLNRSQLSSDLIDTLEKLLGKQENLRVIFKKDAVSDEDGVLHWEEDTFKEWVTSNQPFSVISAFTTRLWEVFIYFAGFPFTERILRDFEAPDQRINEDDFVRAYILLALRGAEVLGNTKDGWTPKGTVENRWSQKAPRLATLLFDGLKIYSSEGGEQCQGLTNRDTTSCAEEQLMNAIVLTQPVPYMTGLSFEKDLRGVARRLLIDNVAPNCDKPSPPAVSRSDFQTFIQLCLLLRLNDRPGKQALILHQTTQMCGDIENMTLVTDEEEITLSARLSHALVECNLGNIDSVSKQSFEAVCTDYPNLILRFYQIWTAICVPHTATSTFENLGVGLLNCVAQFLSIINPVEFDSYLPAGWNQDTQQLQLDLQNATLVADSISKAALNESWLVGQLSNDQCFHILLILAEEVIHENTADTENTERLIALFTSPHDNKMPFWDCPGCPSYIWRYGLVQLLPHILVSQTGGLSASIQHGAIRFSPHHDLDYQSNSVMVDLRNKIVAVDWVDVPVLPFKLKSLKCYRMPGSAVMIHKSSNAG